MNIRNNIVKNIFVFFFKSYIALNLLIAYYFFSYFNAISLIIKTLSLNFFSYQFEYWIILFILFSSYRLCKLEILRHFFLKNLA